MDSSIPQLMDQTCKVIEPQSCGYSVKTTNVSYLSNHQYAVTDMMNSSSVCRAEQLSSLPTEFVASYVEKKTNRQRAYLRWK